ncbi:MAG: hypothetical protein Ta2E_01260 [Mycoplasmoidaceae bacterium]|nr:MAG: hypothetical protein Ta2E_01260 [Mycoplasmoidaceae bacterium]
MNRHSNTERKIEYHFFETSIKLSNSGYNMNLTPDVIDNISNNKRIGLRKAKLEVDRKSDAGQYFSLSMYYFHGRSCYSSINFSRTLTTETVSVLTEMFNEHFNNWPSTIVKNQFGVTTKLEFVNHYTQIDIHWNNRINGDRFSAVSFTADYFDLNSNSITAMDSSWILYTHDRDGNHYSPVTDLNFSSLYFN